MAEPKKFALIIGINYKDRAINPLRGCANDAKTVRSLLETHYGYSSSEIQLLVDDEPGGRYPLDVDDIQNTRQKDDQARLLKHFWREAVIWGSLGYHNIPPFISCSRSLSGSPAQYPAIVLHQEAPPLEACLHDHFERIDDLVDVDPSIEVLEDAVLLTPDPDELPRLQNLGKSLMHRFERLGDLSDLNRSIRVFEDAIQLTPDGHPDKPPCLNNLGGSLLRRFERLGDLSDLDRSIQLQDDAVLLSPDGHSDKPSHLNNLGNSLIRRFEWLGDLSDLNRSIQLLENAILISPDDNPDKPLYLSNLASALMCRFEQLGDLSDLNRSILMREDALLITPDGHPDKPSNLNNLANSLMHRFDWVGNDQPPGYHSDRSITTLNEPGASHTRFKEKGDLADLEEALALQHGPLDLRFGEQSSLPANLSSSLVELFNRNCCFPELKGTNRPCLCNHSPFDPDGNVCLKKVVKIRDVISHSFDETYVDSLLQLIKHRNERKGLLALLGQSLSLADAILTMGTLDEILSKPDKDFKMEIEYMTKISKEVRHAFENFWRVRYSRTLCICGCPPTERLLSAWVVHVHIYLWTDVHALVKRSHNVHDEEALDRQGSIKALEKLYSRLDEYRTRFLPIGTEISTRRGGYTWAGTVIHRMKVKFMSLSCWVTNHTINTSTTKAFYQADHRHIDI